MASRHKEVYTSLAGWRLHKDGLASLDPGDGGIAAARRNRQGTIGEVDENRGMANGPGFSLPGLDHAVKGGHSVFANRVGTDGWTRRQGESEKKNRSGYQYCSYISTVSLRSPFMS